MSIAIIRSFHSRKSFLSGFRSRRIMVCKEENVGTRATRCSHAWRSRIRLEPSRRHDAGFLDKVKGLPWDAQDGIVRGRPRKKPAPPVLVGEDTQSHNPDLPRKTEKTHSETHQETDDTNDPDNVPMSETPMNPRCKPHQVQVGRCLWSATALEV